VIFTEHRDTLNYLEGRIVTLLGRREAVVTIHGGMGLSKELPIERFFRDQRSMMITEGAVEVLRMALARIILR